MNIDSEHLNECEGCEECVDTSTPVFKVGERFVQFVGIECTDILEYERQLIEEAREELLTFEELLEILEAAGHEVSEVTPEVVPEVAPEVEPEPVQEVELEVVSEPVQEVQSVPEKVSPSEKKVEKREPHSSTGAKFISALENKPMRVRKYLQGKGVRY
jgi:hypothetical protein